MEAGMAGDKIQDTRPLQRDRHAIRADVMRLGRQRFGAGFTLQFLSWAYGEQLSTVSDALRADPQSRRGKIIVAHFLGADPQDLWPDDRWGSMLRTYHPSLRLNATPQAFQKARQNNRRGQTQEAA
jgi:lambda repressor-like predicted transcriptional regulator